MDKSTGEGGGAARPRGLSWTEMWGQLRSWSFPINLPGGCGDVSGLWQLLMLTAPYLHAFVLPIPHLLCSPGHTFFPHNIHSFSCARSSLLYVGSFSCCV